MKERWRHVGCRVNIVVLLVSRYCNCDENWDRSVLLHFNVNPTGIVPTWIIISSFQSSLHLFRELTTTRWGRLISTVWNSPDLFVLVVLTDTLIYLKLYMYTIYGNYICDMKSGNSALFYKRPVSEPQRAASVFQVWRERNCTGHEPKECDVTLI